MTFSDLEEKFPTEKDVVNHFLSVRYPYGVTCNHCGSAKVYSQRKSIKIFHCNSCHNTFSPFKDTIFEKSSTDLRKWFYAIHLFLNNKASISAQELQRNIAVTYKTAWRMLQQIRKAVCDSANKEFFNTMFEISETSAAAEPREDNKGDYIDTKTPIVNERGRGTKKKFVVEMVDHADKQVFDETFMPKA